MNKQSPEAYVADAVAKVHSSCGHGPLIFGCVVNGRPFVWCKICGRSYFTIQGLRDWARENARKEKR